MTRQKRYQAKADSMLQCSMESALLNIIKKGSANFALP